MKTILKTFPRFIFILGFSLILGGCLDAKDINSKHLLTAVALDKIDDEIFLYVEIANIDGGNKVDSETGGEKKKYYYVKAHGKTITEAREDLNRILEKPIFLSSIRTLIMTESFAKEHLVEYLYRLRADESYRKKAITVITRENLDNIFKINNAKDISVGFATESLLSSLKVKGESFSRTTIRLLENISTEYTGFLLPTIGIQDEWNALVGYSVVKGSTIDGFIPVEEAKGTIFLKNDKAEFDYIVPYKDKKLTIGIKLAKKKVKSIYKNNKISFDLSFEFNADALYGNKKTPYSFNEKDYKKLNKDIEDMLKQEITEAIYKSQKIYKCDYLQFDDEFRIKYPEEFDQMDWQDEFFKASFNVKIKVALNDDWMMDYKTDKKR